MDNSLILKLVFDGNCYWEKIGVSKNEEYRKNYDALNEIIEKLTKDLPEKEKKKIAWDAFLAMGGIESTTADEYFKEGFKLGLQLAVQNLLD